MSVKEIDVLSKEDKMKAWQIEEMKKRQRREEWQPVPLQIPLGGPAPSRRNRPGWFQI
jgi:hypothetical protein